MLRTVFFALERKFVLKLKVARGKSNGFFIIKQIEKPWLCSAHSRSGEKHSNTSYVSPYTSFVL